MKKTIKFKTDIQSKSIPPTSDKIVINKSFVVDYSDAEGESRSNQSSTSNNNSHNEDEAIDDNLSDTAVIQNENLDIVIMSTSSSTSSSSEIAVKPTNSDSNSSTESGFDTVDDEVESAKAESTSTNQYAPLKPSQQPDLNSNSKDAGDINEDKSFQQQHQIRIPNIQGPRQIIYQLNQNNQPDDIANILNDNSSINSFSSTSSNRLNNCCSNMMEQLNRCYYSCFCCYSTTSHTSHTPFIWSWLSVFCCCCPILGCISLYLTNRSKKFKLKHKYDLAEKYSNYAEKLNIASLIFGVIFYAIVFFLICIFIFMHWRQTKL